MTYRYTWPASWEFWFINIQDDTMNVIKIYIKIWTWSRLYNCEIMQSNPIIITAGYYCIDHMNEMIASGTNYELIYSQRAKFFIWILTHICVSKLTFIGSENVFSPDGRQAIILTNAWILLIWSWRTKFGEILIAIYTYSLRKMHLHVSPGKWRPSCLGLIVLDLRSNMPYSHR